MSIDCSLPEQRINVNNIILTTSEMLKNLTVCTFQTVFGYMCLDLCTAISLHYIGKYDILQNSAYAFAYTCIQILVIPFGFGLNQSLNMHSAQAIGDKKINLAKRYFTLNFYLILITIFPLCLFLYMLKEPFKLIIRENVDQTSELAWKYILYFIPATILALEFESVKTFMIANKITYPFAYIHFITTLIHWFLTWFLMDQLQLGLHGAGTSLLLTEIFNIIGILLFIQYTDLKSTTFKNVNLFPNIQDLLLLGKHYLRTSAPIVIHLYMEFFVFFLFSFVAINLGTEAMNANMSVQNTVGILFRIPISLSLSLVSYVGTEMGRSNIKYAQQYVWAGVALLTITDIIIVAVLYTFQEQWLSFYASDNENIQQLLRNLFPWMIYGTIIIDGAQGTLNGALKGINKINLVFYSTLIAYYAVCIPLVFLLTYDWGLGYGVVGIWQGFSLANLVLFVLYSISLITTDWHKESDIIIQRVTHQNSIHKDDIESELNSLELKMLNL